MDNRTHELNMNELVEALHAAGIEAARYGRSGVVCSLPNGNYIMRLSLTDCSPEIAKRYERDRLNYWIKKYESWEKVALSQANAEEQRAKRHRENAIQYRKMLKELD